MKQLDRTQSLKLWLEMIYHDHGVNYHGGINGCFCGAMGSGKSTLNLTLAEFCEYLPECGKMEYIDSLFGGRTKENMYAEKETVLYRAREYDHWTALIPENWMHSFPKYDTDVKPLHVYIHQDDDLIFCYKKGNENVKIPYMPQVERYRNAYDLIQKIKDGTVCVIYEPTNYHLTDFLYKILEEKRMAKMKREADTPVKSGVFWYELIYMLLKNKPLDYYTVLIDEIHDIAEANPQQDMWHLQDVLAKSFLSMRKQNVSLIGSTHDFELVDYRLTHRFGYWVWLPGSVPSARVSRVWRTAIPSLAKGFGFIEKKQANFGKFDFNRIYRQPPIVHCVDIKAEEKAEADRMCFAEDQVIKSEPETHWVVKAIQ